ncbi:hypothetical protein DMUE_2855 [Dictyocoela muelleri]|nr:hypothetical protein DMUE_2855 [Dictyocoela muelleri]
MFILIAWDCKKTITIENSFKKGLVVNLKNFSVLSNTEEKVYTHAIDHAIDEVDDYEEEESEDINFEDKEEPRYQVKAAIRHFSCFYDIAVKLVSSNLKYFLLLKIELFKEWKTKFKFGSRITDFLNKK